MVGGGYEDELGCFGGLDGYVVFVLVDLGVWDLGDLDLLEEFLEDLLFDFHLWFVWFSV